MRTTRHRRRQRPQPVGLPPQVVRQPKAHHLTGPAAPTPREIAALVTAVIGGAK
jgi:hypothetical protein